MEKDGTSKVILNKTPIHGKDVRSLLPNISLGYKINVTGVVWWDSFLLTGAFQQEV